MAVMLSDTKFKLVRMGGWKVLIIENIASQSQAWTWAWAELGKMKASRLFRTLHTTKFI